MDNAETPSLTAWMNFRISRSTRASSARPCVRLARCSIRKRFNSRTYSRQKSSNRSRRISLSRSATRTRSSTSWRLIVRRLVHVPRDRAPKHAKRSRQYMTYPPPHSAHFGRLEKSIDVSRDHVDGVCVLTASMTPERGNTAPASVFPPCLRQSSVRTAATRGWDEGLRRLAESWATRPASA